MEQHTFIAVPIPHPIQEKIAQYASDVRPFLPLKKWTGLGDYHITVTFLGPTPQEQYPELTEKLQNLSSTHDPFQLKLTVPGVFGNHSKPRVFWAGIDRSEELESLQKGVALACTEAGFNIEDRPYRPHITIGKRWGGLAQQSVEFADLPTGAELHGLEWKVDELILFEILPQKKPMYQPLNRFRLGRTDH
jgi:2'-5' RNA ligase